MTVGHIPKFYVEFGAKWFFFLKNRIGHVRLKFIAANEMKNRLSEESINNSGKIGRKTGLE